ncbi:MAG: hypothetical protein HC934_03980 [Acaryochloridaceae cyanobacterium SU_2_1]|nr:hypothetical protein [Acaryochloridaceae cyanobacterium SU_2_1]
MNTIPNRLRSRLLGVLVALTTAGLVACHHPNEQARTDRDHSGHSTPTTDKISKPDGHSPQHGSHDQTAQAQSQVKLITPNSVTPKQPTLLTLAVQDQQGKAIPKFDVFQEKLMHLIVVSDDLRTFNHIHPEYRQNGRFEVEATFPEGGNYTLFSDYKPTGHAEEISTLKIQATGQAPPAPEIDLRRTKTIETLQATLDSSQPQLQAGEEVTITFTLKDAGSQEPLTDLQPYLGERGHLVILRLSSSLSRTDYIHAHALPKAKEGQVQFKTAFPKAGKYKLWGQFNRNGKIVTTDFWVQVV